MTSTDDRGFVKYWQANLNNVHTFQAHNDPVRSSRWDSLSYIRVMILKCLLNLSKTEIFDNMNAPSKRCYNDVGFACAQLLI